MEISDAYCRRELSDWSGFRLGQAPGGEIEPERGEGVGVGLSLVTGVGSRGTKTHSKLLRTSSS